jgi:hypothetical protein
MVEVIWYSIGFWFPSFVTSFDTKVMDSCSVTPWSRSFPLLSRARQKKRFFNMKKKIGLKPMPTTLLLVRNHESSVCESGKSLVCSLPLHRHSYICFIFSFRFIIHNKQPGPYIINNVRIYEVWNKWWFDSWLGGQGMRCSRMCVSPLFVDLFQLSDDLGYLYRPHQVNHGGVHKDHTQVSLYKSQTTQNPYQQSIGDNELIVDKVVLINKETYVSVLYDWENSLFPTWVCVGLGFSSGSINIISWSTTDVGIPHGTERTLHVWIHCFFRVCRSPLLSCFQTLNPVFLSCGSCLFPVVSITNCNPYSYTLVWVSHPHPRLVRILLTLDLFFELVLRSLFRDRDSARENTCTVNSLVHSHDSYSFRCPSVILAGQTRLTSLSMKYILL